jgi:hypothetical protein
VREIHDQSISGQKATINSGLGWGSLNIAGQYRREYDIDMCLTLELFFKVGPHFSG